jgi:hypothetical protein
MKVTRSALFAASMLLAGCETLTRSPGVQGAPSAAAQPTSRAPSARIVAGAGGFDPARVSIGPDKRVVFRRTTEDTCATEVVFPALGIKRPLPLNTDVVIDLPPSAHGEIGFQCGMAMYRGTVVASERAQ